MLSHKLTAQNTVGVGTNTPNKHAVLDIVSPTGNQGVLLPRLTTAQRTDPQFTSTLTSAENGLIVFDATEDKFYYWKDTQWVEGLGTSISGTNGTIWRSGIGKSADNVGNNGDYYIDASNGNLYEKVNGIYNIILNIKGEAGLKGEVGAQGPQGLQGEKGDKGDQGIQGQKGDPGINGLKGEVGAQGLKGDKGDTGDTGAQGLQGLQGLKGDQGDIGPQGLIGATGEKGDQGLKGDQGDVGPQGLQGIQGMKGDKGDKGDTGPQGIQGVQGEKGDIGVQGQQGIQGIKGDKGDTGAQGLQGIQGLAGANGSNGTDGISSLSKTTVEPTGVNCASGGQKIESGQDLNKNNILDAAEVNSTAYVCNGLQGIQGLKGEKGNTGDVGFQGLQGEKGDTGVQGPQGEKGDKGDVGPPGPKGDKGDTGDTGSQGPKGDKGDTGAIGLQGEVGPRGDKGDTGTQGFAGANGTNGHNSLTKTTLEVAGANCATGGQKIEAGLDINANNILEIGEVASTFYVCNGTQGFAGTNGINGFNSLAKFTGELAGINCSSGGQKIESGLDTNNNNILEVSEITSITYVCNGLQGHKGDKGDSGAQGLQGLQGLQGETGPQGPKGDKGDKGDIGMQGPQGIQGVKGDKGDAGLQGIQGLKGDKGNIGDVGPQGLQGIQGLQGVQGDKGDKGDAGAQGPAGINGYNSLSKTTVEPSGMNCINGGQKIESGQDLNRNDILDDVEISATTFVCNGSNNINSSGTGINISGGVITNTGDTNAGDDITSSSTAGGDLSGTFSNLQLTNVGTGGIYGSATQVPVITTDTKGRVTATTNTTITASGDVTGNINSTTVAGLQGKPVANTAPTTNQILTWDGSQWIPQNYPNGGLSGGTINYIPKWTSSTTLSSTSQVYDNSTNVGIGTNTPGTKLEVDGGLSLTPEMVASGVVNFTVNVGNNSFLKIIGTDNNDQNVTLSNGIKTGQILIIAAYQTNNKKLKLADGGNMNVKHHDLQDEWTITLIWDGSRWLETGFSDN